MLWFTLATCSALLSAAAAVLQKKILFSLNALEFSFAVSLSVVLLSLWIPFTTDITALSPYVLAFIAGKSMVGASAFLLVMMSLRQNQISSALPLLGLTPAATALLSYWIIGERIHGSEWIGIGLMFAGTYFLESQPSAASALPLRSILFSRRYHPALIAVGLFAVSSVVDKVLVSGMHIPPMVVLFYQHLVYTALFFIALLVRSGRSFQFLRTSPTQIPFIMTVAVLTLAYRFTQLEATALAPVALVLAVKRSSIVYASLAGGKIFSEQRIHMTLIGAVLIVAAGFLILRNVG